MDIPWLNLASGYLLLLLPLGILYWYRTGLVGAALLAVVRMTLQLLLVGFYLQYLFRYNRPWLNLLWIAVMVFVATFAILGRSELKRSLFFLPVFASLWAGLLVLMPFTLLFVLDLENPFEARYLIPITGMVLGNNLNAGIVGIRTFYNRLRKEGDRYALYLSQGATVSEALAPFSREAMREAFSPSLASMANIGLISIPGMMTGQMLGGSDPLLAIKYQIMIMLAIHSGVVLNLYSSIRLSRPFLLDPWQMVRSDLYKEESRSPAGDVRSSVPRRRGTKG